MYNIYSWAAALLIIAFLIEYPQFVYQPKKYIKWFGDIMWLELGLFWLKAHLSWNRLWCYTMYGVDIKEVIEKNGEKYFGW